MLRRISVGLIFAAAALAVPMGAVAQTIVVGGKGFTEQLIVAEMTSQLLKANGFAPDKRVGMGSAIVRQAIESGQIDLYWDYTGTVLSLAYKNQERLSAQDAYNKVKNLDAAKGIIWLEPSQVNNTYALGMLSSRSSELGIRSLSDLAAAFKAKKSLLVAVNSEFAARPDGLPGVEKMYDFQVPLDNIKKMDFGLSFQALRDKQVDTAMVTSTDGRIKEMDLIVLKDDKQFFPFYQLTPIIRKPILDANPKLAGLLGGLSKKLDSPTMIRLNADVDIGRRNVEDVARDFLKSQGLL